MKLAAPIIAALALTGCSWIATAKVPDKWTPNQELKCTSHKWLVATDIFVPLALVAVAVSSIVPKYSEEDPDSLSDSKKRWVHAGELATVVGVPWLLVVWASASHGSAWVNTCRDAKKKQKEWLHAHPDEKLKPVKMAPTPPPRLTF